MGLSSHHTLLLNMSKTIKNASGSGRKPKRVELTQEYCSHVQGYRRVNGLAIVTPIRSHLEAYSGGLEKQSPILPKFPDLKNDFRCMQSMGRPEVVTPHP